MSTWKLGLGVVGFLVQSVVLSLSPIAADEQAIICGTVVDEAGSPAAGVEVAIEWHRGGRATARTDREGRFELRLPPQPLGGRLVRAAADEGQRQAHYQLPWEAQSLVEEVRLELRAARRVELHVTDQDGELVADAQAGLLGDYHYLAGGSTDADGRVEFLIPKDARVAYVYALKDGHGLDYRAYVLPRGLSGDQQAQPPELPLDPQRLTLEGAEPLRVRVVESDATPIAGVRLYPWLVKKPDQPEGLNLSFLVDQIAATTDADGWAVFDWIPRWNEREITVWPQSDEHIRQRGSYDPKTGDGTLTIRLDRAVPIRGRATLPDGSPAERIRVVAVGKGYQIDAFHSEVETDADGRYEIKAAPNMVYLVVVKDKRWGSQPHTGFAVWPEQPIEDLDFLLRPATRVFGRVTLGPDEEPVSGQRIYLRQSGRDAHSLEGVELPNPEKSNLWVQPFTTAWATTDADGRYELFIGSGSFYIHGPQQAPGQNFVITDESQLEFNFHAPRPEKGILKGLVVTGDSSQPAPQATISGIYRHAGAGADFSATTDQSGRFEVKRELHRTVLHARSSDGTLAGVVQIEPDDEAVTIPIQPLATAQGRLVDGESGEPLADREIVYGVKVHIGDENSAWRTSFGGKTTTDKEGRFWLDRLILGQNYDVNVTIHDEDNPNRVSWRGVGTVTPEEATEIDLGDLKLQPIQRPPTTEDRVARIFQSDKSPVERFDAAVSDAGIVRQRILVVFADSEVELAERLMTMRYEDSELRRALDWFQVLAIDTFGDKRTDAAKLASMLAADLPDSGAGFVLAVADTDGLPLGGATALEFIAEGRIDKDKLLEFLKSHTPLPLDARRMLDDALANAKAHDKRVIIQETATWCGPCWMLSRFLEKHKEMWSADYILVKMDHRWTGAQEIMQEYRAGASGGIPWWAILDADGEVIITSNDPEGRNSGYPGSERGQAHFRTMLEATAQRLTPDEIDSLVEALKGR